MHSIIIRWHSLILSVLPQLRSMYSSRLSSSYFIFASFILISIPPYCAGNEYHVNGNNPSQFLNVQTLRRLLQTADDPIKAVPACQGTGNRYILSCPTNGYYRPSSPQTPLISPPPPNIADTPPPSSPPSIAPQPKNADTPPPSSPPSSIAPQPKSADTPPPSSPPSSIAPQPKNDIPTRNYPSPSTQGSPNGGRHSKRQHLAIAIASAVLGIVLISFVIIYTIKRGNLSRNKMVCWERGTRKYPFNDEEIMKNFGSMVPKQYTYSEVKKVTNSFKNKLGQGGYGIVYKGKLLDGRLVAVKVLNESKDNGEDFINEVASISRTSHVNIVNLVGFCYERNSRALIYEFMANGSLDQFIYNKSSSLATCHLDEKTMFRIAIGIARGLEYLHRGCRTRILHFDIKPHNILLDEDMCPKISDFGLAKLCRKKESIISMTNMRGTIGYIAPEVFSRNFGVVSHKSDVYSFGMLILEMIGGRKNFDGEVSCSSERDFSHWIYTKLENGKILDTFGEGIEEEENVIKKMILVGLWCIQTNPYDRPSIGKVIEMLEGTLQSLQFPPKPFLYSPPLSPQDSSATS